MPNFDVSSSFVRTAQRLSVIGKETKPAIARAVATLARNLPVEARRDIQNEYALKATRISQGLSTRRDDTSVTLIGSARGIGLIEFGGKWAGRKSAGAVAKVFTQGTSHNYGGTFIAVGRSGNRQIFSRTGKDRLPLKTLYGPSIAQMLRKGDRESRLADLAQATLAIEIDRLLRI